MTDYMIDKLSNFIDDLIEYRLDELEVNIYMDGSRKNKSHYYSFDIDSGVSCTGLSKINQIIHFCVSPQTGLVLLSRYEYDDYRDNNLDFSKKYSEIIEKIHIDRQKSRLDSIVDKSYSDLKLKRDSNINKLIG